MAKNFEDFVKETNGKKYGTGQCYAGYTHYCNWLGIGSKQYIAASMIWTGAPAGQHPDCTSLSASATPQNGDILVYGGGQWGHVGMYYNGYCYGQNQNTSDWTVGGPFNYDIPYKMAGTLLGIFRPLSKFLTNGASSGIKKLNLVNGLVVGIEI